MAARDADREGLLRTPAPPPLTRPIEQFHVISYTDVSAFLHSSPRACLVIAAVIVTLCSVSLCLPGFASLLALVPSHTLGRLYLWNLFTYAFLELGLLFALLDVTVVLTVGRLIEATYGTAEFLRYTLTVVGVCGVLMFLACPVIFELSNQSDVLFSRIHGFYVPLGAYLTSLKQLLPASTISPFATLPFAGRHAPSLYVTLLLALSLWFQELFLLQGVLGVAVAWVYLRFYQRCGEAVGDASGDFDVASFFPEQCAPMIRPLAGTLHRLSLTLNVIAPTEGGRGYTLKLPPNFHSVMYGPLWHGDAALSHAPVVDIEAFPMAVSGEGTSEKNGGAGPDSASIAERQREKGRALLEERLRRSKEGGGDPLPSSHSLP